MSADNYFIKDQNASYFLTFTVVNWIDVFTRMELKKIIVDALNYCSSNKGLIIYAWCLMSNHLHLVCSAKEGHKLSNIIRDFKSFTAKQSIDFIITNTESRRTWMIEQFKYAARFDKRIKTHQFWQKTNHAILVNTNSLINQKIEYVHQNPVKACIVWKAEEYSMSSAIDYSGGKGWVNVILV